MTLRTTEVLFTVLLAMLVYGTFLIPTFSYALGVAANAMCLPWNGACPCGAGINEGKNRCTTGGPNKANCAPGICKDITAGFTTLGICPVAGKCEGVTSAGGGGDLSALQQALGITKQIMDLLKGAGGGAGAGGDTGAGAYPTGCLTGYYSVTTPSSDPCAVYNPGTSSLLQGEANGSSALLNALQGDGSTVPDGNTTVTPGTPTTPGTTQTSTPTPQETPQSPPVVATTTKSLTGEIKIGNAGATIVFNLKEGMSQVVGFFGGNTMNARGALSIAGGLCASRPWSGTGILAQLVPDSFFDALCRTAGYQVGIVAEERQGGGAVVSAPPAPIIPQIPASTTRPLNEGERPFADVWAEPVSVRLGTRAYIFWNSRDVLSCTVAGYNFSHKTLSGGASTVPISGPTTFTMECLAADGSTVQDSVTVQLAL